MRDHGEVLSALETVLRLSRERSGAPSETLDRIARVAEAALAPRKRRSKLGPLTIYLDLGGLALHTRASKALWRALELFGPPRNARPGYAWSLEQIAALGRESGWATFKNIGPVLAAEITTAIALEEARLRAKDAVRPHAVAELLTSDFLTPAELERELR